MGLGGGSPSECQTVFLLEVLDSLNARFHRAILGALKIFSGLIDSVAGVRE